MVPWVGFELLHRTRMLAAPVVNMASSEEGLSALEYEGPFLAPLYRFMTMHPRGSTRSVPACMRFRLNCIAEEVSETRHCPCDSVLWNQTCSLPRVDVQASDDQSERTVALLGRTRKRCPKKVGVVVVGSPSRGLSLGSNQRRETSTDHLDSGWGSQYYPR